MRSLPEENPLIQNSFSRWLKKSHQESRRRVPNTVAMSASQQRTSSTMRFSELAALLINVRYQKRAFGDGRN
jgi:hypothetical protein